MMQASRTLLAILTGLLVASGCGKPVATPEPLRPVLTQVVGANGAAGVTTYTGEIRSRYETQLAFRIPGKIAARLVNAGDSVRTGDVLARLDPADTALSQAAAVAQLELTEADLQRYRDLKAKNFVSQSALDAKETSYKAALAQADLARNQSAYTVLRADKPGVIDQISAEAGQVVAAGQGVMRHSRNDALEVVVAVPESRIAGMRVRQPAEIRLWADDQARYRGQLRELAAVADAVTRTYAARIAIDNPDARLRLGMTAQVVFSENKAVTSSGARVSVPLTAIFQQSGKPAVWVVGADDTLSLRPVEVQAYGEQTAQVLSGLSADERIVIAGVHKLNAGEKIKAVDQQAYR